MASVSFDGGAAVFHCTDAEFAVGFVVFLGVSSSSLYALGTMLLNRLFLSCIAGRPSGTPPAMMGLPWL